MTEPTDADVSAYTGSAAAHWDKAVSRGERPWDEVFGEAAFGLEQVQAVVDRSGYPTELVRLVPGRVEDTVPRHAPGQIALLRLDTDWYESTRHELEHLYPRLASGGVIIVDDYGHWEGCRRAVDEYFGEHGEPLLLTRLDYTGRMAIKH
jgi:hypothetical protein